MLTPELARNILHKVNLQINSNIAPSFPKPGLNPALWLQQLLRTRQALARLSRSYPGEQLSRASLTTQVAGAYSRLRRAYLDDDGPMLHRHLTNSLYQDWKEQGRGAFRLHPLLYDVRLRRAQLLTSEHGAWVQVLLGFRLGEGVAGEAPLSRDYVLERKLDMEGYYVRNWYFVDLGEDLLVKTPQPQ